MVVNSLNFLLFFAVVFSVYYLPRISNPKFQNFWLFICSYFFIGFADWTMIPLLLGATIVFYCIGIWLKIEMKKQNTKRASIITSLGVVLGVCILLYFKYLNFFAESFATLFNAIGIHVSWTTLNIVLPIGVSFFTFKLISYVVEIHREHIEPCKSFIEFGTYIAFFPTILSGPIDRPSKFITQLKEKHCFDYSLALDGSRQLLWGMFTKMCIADNLANITDNVWGAYSSQSSSVLIFVALLFFIQLYADFDGYSNMAIGVSKMLGFRIQRNFNHPLLARNTAEYWRRWHMSLTSWITDYIFMPLNIAFRSLGSLGIIFAVMINLITIGLWHGANWTYGLFGFYHGLVFIPLILSGSFSKNKKIKPNSMGLPTWLDFFKMIGTFCIVSLGLVFFRAPSINDAFQYIVLMIHNNPSEEVLVNTYIKPITFIFIMILIISEWVKRKEEHPLQFSGHFFSKHAIIRWGVYYAIAFAIILYQGQSNSFIYFQF